MYLLTGTKCDKIIQNTIFFVDNGATVVLNCTCFRENESSWNGPDGLNALSNDTLIPYSDGIQISPNLNISNIDIYGNYSIGPPTNLKIINVTEKNIAYGKEGVQMNLTCTVNNGIPSATLIWSKDGLAVSNGSRDSLLYQLTPTRFDHLQNMTCNANSDLLTSPLSQTIYLDILYRPYLTTTQQKDGLLIEGQSTVLCCHSNSNPPAHYMSWDKNYHEIYSWRQNNTTKLDGMNKDVCLPIYTVYRNHTGNYTCVAENSIAKSNSSLSINVYVSSHLQLPKDNPPDVIVTSTISEQNITLHCVANGKPDNYTFYDWEHKSEFKEHIRCIHGTQKGQLVIDKSQKGKENENDGIYMCTVSNGISYLEVKTKKKGQKVIKSHAPPVFVAYNKPVRNGQYGQKLKLKIHVYDRLYNCKVLIKMNDTTLKVKTKKEMIKTYDTFHGVNITVWGQQFTFDLPLTSENDFRNYTVEACNDVGCNYFDVQVQSAYRPEGPTNISVIARRQRVTVLWYPSFNGGFDQDFFLEYTVDLRFKPRVIGPVNDTNEKK
ncbi:unnamed protein product [Mytilus coruscus]|uniref:Ig-like domain-containing protein n=1 Tax=Mytilus coruscus TaxID=42192 RepID=A0A6J8BA36_MYTCO|nr:unnamed protein product [Mytilus coruscus]